MIDKKALSDTELSEVSGGNFDYENFDPSYLQTIEETMVSNEILQCIKKGMSFTETYNHLYNRFFVKFNFRHANSGAPAITETYFRKRCEQIWIEKKGSL